MDKEELLDFLEYTKAITGCFDLGDFSTNEIDTIIKLIKKQNKIINLMAEHLTTPVHDKNWVIKYFEDEVELENDK